LRKSQFSREDAREARLHLTRRGRKIHNAILASAAQRSAYLASGLGKAEVGRPLKPLDLLIQRAGELDATD
jgi:DNA-binding MarR family transcriptional regulator